MELKTYKPFGPSILKAKIPEKIIWSAKDGGISKMESIDIDNYEDLEFAERFLNNKEYKSLLKYHDSIDNLIKN